MPFLGYFKQYISYLTYCECVTKILKCCQCYQEYDLQKKYTSIKLKCYFLFKKKVFI